MAYAEVLTALADPRRRAILEALRERPQTVGELAAKQPVSRPAVSQHLKVLQAAQLTTSRAEGTRRIYAVNRDGFEHLRAYLDGFWSDVLSAFGAEIERRFGEE